MSIKHENTLMSILPPYLTTLTTHFGVVRKLNRRRTPREFYTCTKVSSLSGLHPWSPRNVVGYPARWHECRKFGLCWVLCLKKSQSANLKQERLCTFCKLHPWWHCHTWPSLESIGFAANLQKCGWPKTEWMFPANTNAKHSQREKCPTRRTNVLYPRKYSPNA